MVTGEKYTAEANLRVLRTAKTMPPQTRGVGKKMISRILLLISCILVVASCSSCAGRSIEEQSHKLILEIRSSKREMFSTGIDNFRINLITEQSMASSSLQKLKYPIVQRGSFYVNSYVFLIFDNHRRYISIEPPDEEMQTFILGIPYMPVTCEWTEWRKPDFIGSSDWDIMHDQKHELRNTSMPTEYYELRYRIEK